MKLLARGAGAGRDDCATEAGHRKYYNGERRIFMKRFLIIFTVLSSMPILVTLSFIAAGAQTPSSPPAKVWELSMSNHAPVKHPLHVRAWIPLAEELARESKGRLKPSLFPAAALAKADAALDMCQKGAIDIAMVFPMYTPSRFPLSDIMGLPFAVPSAEAGRRVVGELFGKNLLDQALHDRIMTWIGTTSPYQFFLKKKVMKYEDLKGLRLRTPGGLQTEALKALGATPLTVPGAEFQTAFERGVIDGGVVDFGSGPGYKLQEYTKHVIVANMGVAASAITMNKAKYDSLPKDLQKVIDKAMQNWAIKQAKSYDDADKDSAEVFTKVGASVYTLPPAERSRWMKATEPVYSQWLNDMKKKGLAGDKTYGEFKKLMKEYGVELPL